ncbi:hypothetical protein HYU94_01645 [Candidatus Daviesbacteria bacterium]|nr:hypothetical protein [Candidatus Daviesbacteria bacterium]
MSKKQQVKKNLELSAKLADYLAKNQDIEEKTAKDISYVFFSATDQLLNKNNLKLARSLIKEGKVVVKAEETKNRSNPWKLIPLTP